MKGRFLSLLGASLALRLFIAAALVFTGDPGLKGQPTKDEVLRLSFAIEFLP